jgi:hypothetical protein
VAARAKELILISNELEIVKIYMQYVNSIDKKAHTRKTKIKMEHFPVVERKFMAISNFNFDGSVGRQ